MKKLITIFVCFFIILGCSPQQNPGEQGSASQNSGERSSVFQASNESVTITLRGNSGTGYSWSYTGGEGIVEETTQTTDIEKPKVAGSAAVYTFNFRGVKSGEAVLTFTYSRPWEKDTAPAETRQYLFKVDNQNRISATEITAP